MCLVLSPLEAPHDKPLQRKLNFCGHFVVVIVAVLLTYGIKAIKADSGRSI